jgi:hypothetical protein
LPSKIIVKHLKQDIKHYEMKIKQTRKNTPNIKRINTKLTKGEKEIYL